jgi:hypothetical protein
MASIENVINFGDNWTLAKGTDQTVTRLIRIREKLNPEILARTLPHLLRVSWSMLDKTEMGLLSHKETNELEQFENELVPRVEAGGTCVLAAVITESGKRHWYFYLSDVDAFSEGLHNVPQKKEPYPIEVTRHKNEGWNLYRELVASCKG